MKRFILILLLFNVIFNAAYASRTKKYLRRCTSCMQEGTQVRNHILLAQKYTRQLQEYDIQIRHLETALIQAKRADMVISSVDIEDLIRQTADVSRFMNALGAEISDAERQMHADFPEYKDIQVLQGADFYRNYSKLAALSADSLKASVMAGGIQMENMQNEMDVLRKLRDMSRSAEGRMQAAQTANAIALEKLKDAKRLRQLIVVQNNAMNAYLMKRQNKRMQDMKMQQDFLKEMRQAGF